MNPKIYLASTSPFRKALMEEAGIQFEAIAPECDEKSIVGFAPREQARRRAELKGFDVASRLNVKGLVIGSDQVLSLEEACFDKALSLEEARMRLRQFSGRVHTLHSAVAVFEVDPSKKMISLVVSDVVDVGMKMRTLSDETIEQYLKTDEWRGVVGCYRIEGEGRHLFDQVDGDRSEIIGLPMAGLKTTIEAYLKSH